MPLIEDDTCANGLNDFIDVAIKDDRELNPIVISSRAIRSISRRLADISTDNGSCKSFYSEPARPSSKQKLQQRKEETLLDVDLNHEESIVSIRLHIEDESTEASEERTLQRSRDSNMSLGQRSRDSSRSFGPRESRMSLGDSAERMTGGRCHAVGESSAEGQVGEIKQADAKAVRIETLEQDLAKISFELAEARSQCDWYKMQHRQLHVEFEDLQAFCHKLQDENLQLRTNSAGRRARPAWFKAAQRLNQPRVRTEYRSTTHSRDSTVSRDSQLTPIDDSTRSDFADDDWDADTLTTAFGGVHGGSEANQTTGPLMSMLNRARTRGGTVSSSEDDTPTDITVNKKQVQSDDEEDLGINDFYNSAHISVESEDDVQESPNDQAEIPRRKMGFLSNFRQGRDSTASGQPIDSVKAAQSTKATHIDQALQGRRPSLLEMYRFIPQRRGSALDDPKGSSHSSTLMNGEAASAHSSNVAIELDELDIDFSHPKEGEAHYSEVTVSSEKLTTDPNNKNWWANVKPIKQIQQIQSKADKAMHNVRQHRRRKVEEVEEDEEDYTGALSDDHGHKCTQRPLSAIREQNSKSFDSSSGDEMPCDLSEPSLHPPHFDTAQPKHVSFDSQFDICPSRWK